MNLLLIKKIALSTITISLNIVPTQVLAFSEVNHQSNQYIIDTYSTDQLSKPSILAPVFSEYEPPKNGKPGDTDGTGAR